MNGITHADVIIIGGGIHGSSAALQLAKAGKRVLMLEKNYVARHASGVNAGGVRTLTRHMAEVPLSLASQQMWANIQEHVDDDCGFEVTGQIRVAENESDEKILSDRFTMMQSNGYIHEEWVDAVGVRDMIPSITPNILGGLIARSDGAADPYRTTTAFRLKAQQYGADIREGVTVKTVVRQSQGWLVDTTRGRFGSEVLVNCAGAWADQISAQFGEIVPLKPIAPMMLVTSRMPHFLSLVVLGTGRALSFKQRTNGTVLIGGGRLAWVDRDRDITELDFRTLADSARTVCDLFPHMRNASVNRGWAGIEASMPDGIPVIGASNTEQNLFHAFGFSAHGFQLGPIVGKILSELIITGSTNLPIEPFNISRFAASSQAPAGAYPFAT